MITSTGKFFAACQYGTVGKVRADLDVNAKRHGTEHPCTIPVVDSVILIILLPELFAAIVTS